MSEVFIAGLTIIFAYFVGSISSAVLICRMSNLPDPRTKGSKNPGATNVLRMAGKGHAALVLIADILKGVIPVVLAQALELSTSEMAYVCLAAVFGHMYPVFFGFKGGKGVATALGAFLAFHFIMGVVAIAIWLVVTNYTRLSSLASIITITLMPFLSLFAVGNIDGFYPLLVIAVFVLYKHRENISRLMIGAEPKVTIKSPLTPQTEAPMAPTEAPKPTKRPPVKAKKKAPAKKAKHAKRAKK